MDGNLPGFFLRGLLWEDGFAITSVCCRDGGLVHRQELSHHTKKMGGSAEELLKQCCVNMADKIISTKLVDTIPKPA